MSLSAALEADVAALEADAAVQGYWQRTANLSHGAFPGDR
jgi:hypothetical protein